MSLKGVMLKKHKYDVIVTLPQVGTCLDKETNTANFVYNTHCKLQYLHYIMLYQTIHTHTFSISFVADISWIFIHFG